MARIFVSYRREDSPGHTGRLYDHLVAHYGAETIFRDIEAIELGEDFKKAIEQAVGSSNVLLAVIGPQWLRVQDKQGRRRLDDPKDFVRLEIAAALARGIRVIPVLVNNATMPAEEELPPDLAPLALRNALEISDIRFPSDVEHLIHSIDAVLDWAPAPSQQPPIEHRQQAPVPAAVGKGRRNTLTWLILAGGAVLAGALLILLARPLLPPKHRPSAEPPRQEDVGTTQRQKEGAHQPEAVEAPTQEEQPATQPRKFSSREGNFTVMMPGTPTFSSDESAIQGGEVKLFVWVSNVDDINYVIMLYETPETLEALKTLAAMIKRLKLNNVLPETGTIESSTKRAISLQDNSGTENTYVTTLGIYRERNYSVGTRIYKVSGFYDPRNIDPQKRDAARRKVDDFLNSFRLINPPPPERPRQGRTPTGD